MPVGSEGSFTAEALAHVESECSELLGVAGAAEEAAGVIGSGLPEVGAFLGVSGRGFAEEVYAVDVVEPCGECGNGLDEESNADPVDRGVIGPCAMSRSGQNDLLNSVSCGPQAEETSSSFVNLAPVRGGGGRGLVL